MARLTRHAGAAPTDSDHDDHSGDGGGWRGPPPVHPRHLDEALSALLRGVGALDEAAAACRQASAAAVPAYIGAATAAAPGDRAALNGLLDDTHMTLVGIRRLVKQAARAAAATAAGAAAPTHDGSAVGIRAGTPVSNNGRRCDSVAAAGVDTGSTSRRRGGQRHGAVCGEQWSRPRGVGDNPWWQRQRWEQRQQ